MDEVLKGAVPAGEPDPSGQPDRAVQTYLDLLSKVKATNPNPEGDLGNAVSMSSALASLAGILRRESRGQDAARWEDECRRIWQHWEQALPNNAFVHRQLVSRGTDRGTARLRF